MRGKLLVVLLAAGALAGFAPAPAPAACTPPYCPSGTLQVVLAGNGTGTVTSSPTGIDCGSACKAEYEEGTQVTLTASADPGSTFTGWTGGGGCSGTGRCTVTIRVHTTVTAIFKRPAPPRPPGAGRFQLHKVKHPATGVVTIRVRVAEPGVFSATAKRMKAARRKRRKAGSFTLKLRLDRAGLRALRASEGRQLRIRVAFELTPAEGKPVKKLKKLIFRVEPAPPRPTAGRGAAATLARAASGGKVVVAAAATIKQGKALIRVFCNGPLSCRGTLKLVAFGNTLLGSTSFNLAAGRSRVLRLKLSGHARKLLDSRRSPRQARATGTGLHPHAVKLKPAG